MKKLLVVLGLLVLVPGLALAQSPSYFVNYYTNNSAPFTADQIVRVINAGTLGSPLTVPVGDICANFYVHDPNQEMIACCASSLTPNELSSAYAGKQLTFNPINAGYLPTNGVIKVVLTPNPSGKTCHPEGWSGAPDATLGEIFATHLQVTGGATYVTETELLSSPLGSDEAAYLQETCFFVELLGSGTGVCKITTSSGQK